MEGFPPPPGVLASLQAGFTVVSPNHIGLILCRYCLMLSCGWVRFSVGKLYETFLERLVDLLRRNNFSCPELAIYTENMPILRDNRLHWLLLWRTLPIPEIMLELPMKFPMPAPACRRSFHRSPFLMYWFPSRPDGDRLVAGVVFPPCGCVQFGSEEAGVSLTGMVADILLSVLWGVGFFVMLILLMLVFLSG